MVIDQLEQKNVTAYFDPDTSIAHITYRGQLSAEESDAAYTWLEKVLETVGTQNIFGEIWDFRQVTLFSSDNLIDARKHSRKLNITMDVHNFPIAMIIRNSMQEEILRGPMRNLEGNTRKRIVRTPAEALQFINSWHEAHPQ